jgi:hypothetical protein
MEALEQQKAQAGKWMHQQNLRIMIQAEEGIAARRAMAEFFTLQKNLLNQLKNAPQA